MSMRGVADRVAIGDYANTSDRVDPLEDGVEDDRSLLIQSLRPFMSGTGSVCFGCGVESYRAIRMATGVLPGPEHHPVARASLVAQQGRDLGLHVAR